MVGEYGTILGTRNGGTSWKPLISWTGNDLSSVHSADTHIGLAVGTGGTILRTRDGGTHWWPQKSGTDQNLYGVHFADAHTTGWAVGDGAGRSCIRGY